MKNPTSATGTCLCNAVTLSFSLAEEVFDACHCGMCRKWGGGPIFTLSGGSQVTFKGEDSVVVYDSSAWAQRGFCKNCGTHLFYRLKKDGNYHLPVGLIENHEKLKFHLQIFVDRKPDHYSFADKTAMMTEAQVFAKHTGN